MSLTVASSYNAVTFAQQQGNVGFATAYQGPDTVAYSLNYQVDAFNLNAVTSWHRRCRFIKRTSSQQWLPVVL